MHKTLANPRIKRAIINIVTDGFNMESVLVCRNTQTTYNSMQILEECPQLLR